MLPLASLGRHLLPELLYVFVAGPGTGEGIAIALPGADWIVIDGCEVGGASVTAAILDAHARPNDVQRAFFLTHPHDDHVGGVPQLLESHPPEAIWLTAKAPHGPHLLEVCRGWLAKLEAQPTSDALRARGVHGALKAIAGWEAKTNRSISRAVEGASMSIGEVAVTVCAPAVSGHLDAVLAELEAGARRRANHSSVVLELSYGATRIVLGGDLPRVETGSGEIVPTGWDQVMCTRPTLAAHRLLKLAHHGSTAAWHDGLMASPPSGRAWAVTPFARSGLPRAASLPDLLAREKPLCVSHPPPSWHFVRAAPGAEVSTSAIRDRRDAEKTSDPFADAAADIRPDPPADPLHPVWAFAFDASAVLRGAWHGETALAVV